jgi:hypothetical protein
MAPCLRKPVAFTSCEASGFVKHISNIFYGEDILKM